MTQVKAFRIRFTNPNTNPMGLEQLASEKLVSEDLVPVYKKQFNVLSVQEETINI